MISTTLDRPYLLYSPYMSPEGNRRHIPEWAERERLSDLAWIAENIPQFWEAAQQGFEASGRGAIAVDTTVQPDPDKGNPMYYFSLDDVMLLPFVTEDEVRMVTQYDPSWQFVAMLLKEQERVSSYRVGVPGQQPGRSVPGRR